MKKKNLKWFSPIAMAEKAMIKSKKCQRKLFCKACFEDVFREAFDMGRSGKYE